VLELAEVVTNQCDLVRAGQRHGIGDLHRRVLTLEHAPSRCGKPTEVGLAGALERKRRLVIRGSTRVAGVERLNPEPAVVPERGVVAGHGDRWNAIAIQGPELLRHPLNHFELPPELVQLLVGTLLYQDRLRQVRWVEDDNLRSQGHCNDGYSEQRDPYTT